MHPYSDDVSPLDARSTIDPRYSFVRGVPKIREVMQRNGDIRPIWLTESGWSTSTLRTADHWRNGVSEATQAAFMRQQAEQIARWPYVKVNIWFNLLDAGERPRRPVLNCGLLRVNGTAKPAYAALRDRRGDARRRRPGGREDGAREPAPPPPKPPGRHREGQGEEGAAGAGARRKARRARAAKARPRRAPQARPRSRPPAATPPPGAESPRRRLPSRGRESWRRARPIVAVALPRRASPPAPRVRSSCMRRRARRGPRAARRPAAVGAVVGVRPIVGVQLALLAVPLEFFSLRVGTCGLSPTEMLMLLTAGCALLHWSVGGRSHRSRGSLPGGGRHLRGCALELRRGRGHR